MLSLIRRLLNVAVAEVAVFQQCSPAVTLEGQVMPGVRRVGWTNDVSEKGVSALEEDDDCSRACACAPLLP